MPQKKKHFSYKVDSYLRDKFLSSRTRQRRELCGAEACVRCWNHCRFLFVCSLSLLQVLTPWVLSASEVVTVLLIYFLATSRSLIIHEQPARFHFSYWHSLEDVVGLSCSRAALLASSYAVGVHYLHRPYLYASYLLAALCFPYLVVKMILFQYGRDAAPAATLLALTSLYCWLHVFAARHTVEWARRRYQLGLGVGSWDDECGGMAGGDGTAGSSPTAGGSAWSMLKRSDSEDDLSGTCCKGSAVLRGARYGSGTGSEDVPPDALADEDSKFLQLAGIKVHYKEFVPSGRFSGAIGGEDAASQTGIVLVHGFGAGVFAWRHVLEPLALQCHCRVIAFDRPAFGLTSRPGVRPGEANPYTLGAQARLLLRVCRALGLTKVVFVGHADGCLVTLRAVAMALKSDAEADAGVPGNALLASQGRQGSGVQLSQAGSREDGVLPLSRSSSRSSGLTPILSPDERTHSSLHLRSLLGSPQTSTAGSAPPAHKEAAPGGGSSPLMLVPPAQQQGVAGAGLSLQQQQEHRGVATARGVTQGGGVYQAPPVLVLPRAHVGSGSHSPLIGHSTHSSSSLAKGDGVSAQGQGTVPSEHQLPQQQEGNNVSSLARGPVLHQHHASFNSAVDGSLPSSTTTWATAHSHQGSGASNSSMQPPLLTQATAGTQGSTSSFVTPLSSAAALSELPLSRSRNHLSPDLGSPRTSYSSGVSAGPGYPQGPPYQAPAPVLSDSAPLPGTGASTQAPYQLQGPGQPLSTSNVTHQHGVMAPYAWSRLSDVTLPASKSSAARSDDALAGSVLSHASALNGDPAMLPGAGDFVHDQQGQAWGQAGAGYHALSGGAGLSLSAGPSASLHKAGPMSARSSQAGQLPGAAAGVAVAAVGGIAQPQPQAPSLRPPLGPGMGAGGGGAAVRSDACPPHYKAGGARHRRAQSTPMAMDGRPPAQQPAMSSHTSVMMISEMQGGGQGQGGMLRDSDAEGSFSSLEEEGWQEDGPWPAVVGLALLHPNLVGTQGPTLSRLLASSRLGRSILRPLLRSELGEVANRRAWHNTHKLTQEVVELYKAPLRVEGWCESLIETTRLRRDQAQGDLPAYLAAARHLPALILTGEHDRIVPPPKAELLSTDLPHSQISIVPGCGHLSHEEVPDALLAQLVPFCAHVLLPQQATPGGMEHL